MPDGAADEPAADERPWTVERLFAELRGVLGEHYRVTADDCFAWLTPFAPDDHERVAAVARHGVRRLGELVPGLRADPPPGGWPAILFATLDAHLAYKGFFGGAAEERIISGGSYRSHPIGHLAIPVSSQDALDAAFAHELTHAMLSPRRMPTWLQEGIACEVETRLGNRRNPFTDRRELDECIAYWRAHAAVDFWSGRAFGHPESSRHAYLLAQIIVGRWTRDAAAMSALCALGPDDWRGRRSILGIERERLFAGAVWPSRKRGWLERALYAIFVDEERPR
jgi:hypothetical protein